MIDSVFGLLGAFFVIILLALMVNVPSVIRNIKAGMENRRKVREKRYEKMRRKMKMPGLVKVNPVLALQEHNNLN